MNRKTTIGVILIILCLSLFLTSCGGISDAEKAQWTATYNELERKIDEHNQAVKEMEEYFDSLSDDLVELREKVGFFNMKDVVENHFSGSNNISSHSFKTYSPLYAKTPPEKKDEYDRSYPKLVSELDAIKKWNRPSLSDVKAYCEEIIREAQKELDMEKAKAEDIVGLWGGLIDGEIYSLEFSIASGKQICDFSLVGIDFSGIFEISADGVITISVDVEGGAVEKFVYRYDKSTDKLEANIPKLGGWINLPRVK